MQDLQKKPLPTFTQQQNSPQSELKLQSPINSSPYKEPKSQTPLQSPYKITPKKPSASPPRFVAQKKVVAEGIVGTEVKSERGIFTVRSGNQQIVVGTDIEISIVVNDQQEGLYLYFATFRF